MYSSHWVPIAIGLFIHIPLNSLDDRAHHGLQYLHHIKVPVMFRALVSTGAKGAAAPVNLGQRVHAPVNF